MIGEATSALVNQHNIDRVYKENAVKSQDSTTSTSSKENAAASTVTDTASFSPAALALSRQVQPVETAPAEEQLESMGTPENVKTDSDDTGQAPKSIDIRV